MDSVPAESHASGSPIPSILRQRMLKRAATFTEGAVQQQPPPALPARRRSSLLSNLSDAPHSLRSSTDSLLRPDSRHDMEGSTHFDGPTVWHSSPILFAVLPAVAALTHQNGGAFATDILLILLACWFMSKCVVVPWEWYHNAQQRQYPGLEAPFEDDTILKEDDDSSGSPELQDSAKACSDDTKLATPVPTNHAAESAQKELRREELLAFASCFLGPLLGAYLLHTIRSQLTSATRDGIISDLNLTIFVLAAEMRPVSRLIEMMNERTLHLQRIVQAAPGTKLRTSDAQELTQKLADLETRFDESMYNSNADVIKASTDVRQSMQIQLDALNRAVRKYEKRHMAQSIQIEARFQEIDLRLKDTLSLAAAAARTGQRPGLLAMMINWVTSVVNYNLQLAWDIVLYPWRFAASLITLANSWIFDGKRQSRRATRGQVNGHSSTSTSRMQSKNSR